MVFAEPAVARERARTTRLVSRALRAQSTWLRAQAVEASRARLIQGGNDIDVTFVASLITDAVLCGDCVAIKVDVPRWKTDEMLPRIGKTLRIVTTVGCCDSCSKQTVVYTLA